MNIQFVRKVKHRILKSYTKQTNKLKSVKIIRKLTNRSKFQYQIVFDDNSVVEVKNFKEIRFYINYHLRDKFMHLLLTREDNNEIEIYNSSC